MTTTDSSTRSSVQTESRLEQADEAFHSRRRLLIAVFIAIALLQTFLLYVVWRPFEPLVKIDNMQMLSGGVMCPGSVMLTHYDITVREAGVVDVATSVTRENGTPVMTRAPVRLIFPRAMTMTVETAWRLPRFYNSQLGGGRQWQTGQYVRLTAITTTSRGGTPVIVEQPFRITRCPDREKN
jgi:hypothetical protein